MSHHKRRKPKNARSGCLLCKPHKINGTSKEHKALPNQRRNLIASREAIREYYQNRPLKRA